MATSRYFFGMGKRGFAGLFVIHFSCFQCRSKLIEDSKLCGTESTCPSCDTLLKIPSSVSEAEVAYATYKRRGGGTVKGPLSPPIKVLEQTTEKQTAEKMEVLEQTTEEVRVKGKKLAVEKVRAIEASERKLASRPKVRNFEDVSLQTEVPRKSVVCQLLSSFLTLIVICGVAIPTVIAVFTERKWGDAAINIVVTALPTVGVLASLLYLASVLHDIRYFLAEQTAEIKSSQEK